MPIINPTPRRFCAPAMNVSVKTFSPERSMIPTSNVASGREHPGHGRSEHDHQHQDRVGRRETDLACKRSHMNAALSPAGDGRGGSDSLFHKSHAPLFRRSFLAQLAFHNLINFFEPRVGIGADLLNSFLECGSKFLILQLAQVNPDVHCCAANAGAHCQDSNAHI